MIDKEKRRLRNKRYYDSHTEFVIGRSKKYYEANTEKMKEYSKKRYYENQDQFLEEKKIYNTENKEKVNEQQRKTQKKMMLLYPEKEIARAKAKYHFKELKPCEVCGTEENIHKHHDDYSKPLEIRFLCIRHHAAFHAQQKEGI